MFNWLMKKLTVKETLDYVMYDMGTMNVSLAIGRKKWEDGEEVKVFAKTISTEGYDNPAQAIKEGIEELRSEIDYYIWTQIDKSIPLDKYKMTVAAPLSIIDTGDGYRRLHTEIGVILEED